MTTSRPVAFAAIMVVIAATSVAGQATLPRATRASIDSAVKAAMALSGAPSVSIAVVKDGAIAYANAYGLAKLEPSTPATPGGPSAVLAPAYWTVIVAFIPRARCGVQ
jgi:CubicO group peptidase (beta-lactamase class C family)